MGLAEDALSRLNAFANETHCKQTMAQIWTPQPDTGSPSVAEAAVNEFGPDLAAAATDAANWAASNLGGDVPQPAVHNYQGGEGKRPTH